MHDNPCGDDRYYNNLFVGRADLSLYDRRAIARLDGRQCLSERSQASQYEKDPLVKPEFDPAIKMVETSAGFELEMTFDPAWAAERTRPRVTTEKLGRAAIPNLSWEQPDGSPISVSTDYAGKIRSDTNPFPGPFENPGSGRAVLKVW